MDKILILEDEDKHAQNTIQLLPILSYPQLVNIHEILILQIRNIIECLLAFIAFNFSNCSGICGSLARCHHGAIDDDGGFSELFTAGSMLTISEHEVDDCEANEDEQDDEEAKVGDEAAVVEGGFGGGIEMGSNYLCEGRMVSFC